MFENSEILFTYAYKCASSSKIKEIFLFTIHHSSFIFYFVVIRNNEVP